MHPQTIVSRSADVVLYKKHSVIKLENEEFEVPLVGLFNAYNALGAIALAKELGLIKRKPRKNHSSQIDEFMEKRIVQVKCNKCNGELKQSRKGSFVGICTNCGAKFTLGKRRKGN